MLIHDLAAIRSQLPRLGVDVVLTGSLSGSTDKLGRFHLGDNCDDAWGGMQPAQIDLSTSTVKVCAMCRPPDRDSNLRRFGVLTWALAAYNKARLSVDAAAESSTMEPRDIAANLAQLKETVVSTTWFEHDPQLMSAYVLLRQWVDQLTAEFTRLVRGPQSRDFLTDVCRQFAADHVDTVPHGRWAVACSPRRSDKIADYRYSDCFFSHRDLMDALCFVWGDTTSHDPWVCTAPPAAVAEVIRALARDQGRDVHIAALPDNADMALVETMWGVWDPDSSGPLGDLPTAATTATALLRP